MYLLWKFIFVVCFFQGWAFASLCERTFSDPESFTKAMTEGLVLREGQDPLMAFYLKSNTPYPSEDGGRNLNDVLGILESYPELSKPFLREQVLEFAVTEKKSPKSLKNFVRSFNSSEARIRNNLFQIEANLGFWMKMLGFPPSIPTAVSKEHKKTLKKQQQRDFIAWLDTTPLNQDTRDFIKDSSKPYRERTITLYKALEQIRADFVTSDTEAKAVGQAMADLVHIAGFGNDNYKALLKSSDPTQSYEALRNILNERDRLAFDLGFEGHFKEMKEKLGSKIPEESKVLQQIAEDIQNQPHTIKGTEVWRLRQLSLQEAPFRGCFGGDCATRTYFEKALDPNFLYFTLTDGQNRSSGQVTVVLGSATNEQGQKVKTAFVDKIQGVSPERLEAMLEGIRLSLTDKGYVLGLPKDVGDGHIGLANEPLTEAYVESNILPKLYKSLEDFRPHKHEYEFLLDNDGYSQSYKKLPLLVFEGITLKDVKIQVGSFPKPELASPSLSIRSLYEPILRLKDSTKEEEQLRFLSHLPVMFDIEELGLSRQYVEEHVDFVLNNKGFSFKVRKKALYISFQLQLWPDDYTVQRLTYLNNIMALFSKQEQQVLTGEMSNWKNTTDWRKSAIKELMLSLFWSFLNPSVIRNRMGNRGQILTALHNKLFDKDFMLIELVQSQGYIKEVEGLLKIGADPNSKDTYGKPILVEAVEQGHADVVSLLLKAGADPNSKDTYGKPILVEAVEQGHADVVSLLLKAGADPNSKDTYGTPALVRASDNGQTEIVSLLLKAKADPNNIEDQYGYTGLWLASSEGQTEIVSLLLKAGADPNSKDTQGKSALIEAVEQGHADVVSLLLKAGADPNSKDTYGTPALVRASENGQTEIVSLLLKAGADPNSKDTQGKSALIEAVEQGHADVVIVVKSRGRPQFQRYIRNTGFG